MPKLKTNSSAKKRFIRVAGGKKIKRSKAFRRKLLRRKTTKRKRNLRKNTYIFKADFSRFKVLLPYKR